MTRAEKLRELRRAAGLSQEELAEKLDVTRQSVSKWEAGAAVPEVEKLVVLAGIFGVTMDELLLVEDAAKPEAPPPLFDPVPPTGEAPADGAPVTGPTKNDIRWRYGLIAAAAVSLLVSCTTSLVLLGKVHELEITQDALMAQVTDTQMRFGTVFSEIDALKDGLNGEPESALFADFDISQEKPDFAGKKRICVFTAVPRQYEEGMQVVLLVRYDGITETIPLTNIPGTAQFSGGGPFPLGKNCEIIGQVNRSGVIETERLPSLSTNPEDYMLFVNIGSGNGSSYGWGDGKVNFEEKLEIYFERPYETTPDPVKAVMRGLVNGEEVYSEETDLVELIEGGVDGVLSSVVLPFNWEYSDMKAGDTLTIALELTDSNGTRYQTTIHEFHSNDGETIQQTYEGMNPQVEAVW